MANKRFLPLCIVSNDEYDDRFWLSQREYWIIDVDTKTGIAYTYCVADEEGVHSLDIYFKREEIREEIRKSLAPAGSYQRSQRL